MTASRPVASVSLDLDDLWTYLRTRGDPSWQARPSYLPRFLPLLLEVFQQLEHRITVFVVGFDAARESNQPHLRALADHGHEMGSHSFHHETWMQLLPPDRLEEEIVAAEQAIQGATGQKPVGFRGPGFTWSPQLLEVLARHQYVYDASTLPTFIGPLARRYLIGSARLSAEERAQRGALFGAFSDGFRPNTPYRWELAEGRSLLEMPVTTMPVTRLPFHMSYLLYLSCFSPALMRAYLRTAIAACKLFRVEPSFLLHPLDLLGGDAVPQLGFFPGMNLTTERKRRLFVEVFEMLGSEFDLITLGSHAGRLSTNELARRAPLLAT
jgi:peptidoglycan/xylan/chitin deacetylase (PgdA/CDA1 family)